MPTRGPRPGDRRRRARVFARNRWIASALALAVGAATAAGQGNVSPPAPPPQPAPASAAAAAAATATAAPPAGPAVGPPVRRIETASAVSTEPLGAITSVRELSDGRVLVNDGQRRRLLLMDSMLTTISVVLDSSAAARNGYGIRAGGLIPARGDTTLFFDAASYAILVIDPQGRIARVRAVPRMQDVGYYSGANGSYYGFPGFDAKGRLIYRIPAEAAPPAVPPPRDVPYIPPDPDSAFIVGIDLDSRKVDTLGAVRVPKSLYIVRMAPTGGYSFYYYSFPLPIVDDWAVMPDGAIAFLRGRDYRIDWLNADGSRASSPKVPYEWQRLDDDAKQRFADSVTAVDAKAALDAYVSSMIRWVNQYNKPYPKGFTVPEGFVPLPGFAKDWIFPPGGVTFPANYIYACAPGVTPPPPTGGQLPSCLAAPPVFPSGSAPPQPTKRDATITPASDVPDYRPPFVSGSTRADLDGNLWIHFNPAKPIPGGPVYDLVNRQGVLFDRLQLPVGYTLVGFGAGRVVYVSMRDAKGVHLARVRLK